jgi:hypothetical protein
MHECNAHFGFLFISSLASWDVTTGDGLGAPDIVLGRVKPKKAFGRVAGGGETSNAPQIAWGTV